MLLGVGLISPMFRSERSTFVVCRFSERPSTVQDGSLKPPSKYLATWSDLLVCKCGSSDRDQQPCAWTTEPRGTCDQAHPVLLQCIATHVPPRSHLRSVVQKQLETTMELAGLR